MITSSIIYSYNVHENKDAFIDTLKNLFYFHKSLEIFVIINANDRMLKELPNEINKLKMKDQIVIYPISMNKRLYTYDILEGHVRNFIYCIENSIKSKYFIPLSSNCMFKSNVTIEYVDNMIINKITINDDKKHISDMNNKINLIGHWKNVDPKVIDILEKNNMYYKHLDGIIQIQHEGFIIEYEVMNQIQNFLINNSIRNIITQETVYEETIFQSIYKNITNTIPTHICKVFWENVNYTPRINEIKKCDLPCVKRVHRNFNDPTRIWLRNNNNNYE